MRNHDEHQTELSQRPLALDAVQSVRQLQQRGSTGKPNRAGEIGFAYLRVSTREQARSGGGAEGYSIPAQREACYARARQMSVMIQEEYVDAGESARSANNRDELQQMLKAIKEVRPDYVFVHKIDRLARNREDDIAINLLLRKHGVRLISCTENIDDTPSGKLLHSLMAGISQFYSDNLAQEVLKGLVRKAMEGGTPFRAPLGYVNCRESRDGIERSWVELDYERAEIIRWCFNQYATGEWSGIDLTLAAQAKGLTSRPTRNRPAQPIGLTGMYHILQNPYYMGVVSYQGIHYEGKHPILVEPDVWLDVQHILAAHNHTGEKDRVHNHYLRSTIYCSECGGRKVYSRNTGNGGTYEYFICVRRKTKTNNCQRRAVRVEKVEAGIAAFYSGFRVPQRYAEQLRAAVREELASQRAEASRSLERARRGKQRVEDERQKLLQAHYADAVPKDLLASEMKRLTRELASADAEMAAAKATNADVEAVLAGALEAASHCEQAYLTAPDTIRRQINQGFFTKLFIGEDGNVESAELTEPFAAILADTSLVYARVTPSEAAIPAPRLAGDTTDESDVTNHTGRHTHPSGDLLTFGETITASVHTTTSGELALPGRGVKDDHMVGMTGFEPATLRSQSECATKLRHIPADPPVSRGVCTQPSASR
ncbi:recombinase family protein [Amycolatopsis samaneae]